MTSAARRTTCWRRRCIRLFFSAAFGFTWFRLTRLSFIGFGFTGFGFTGFSFTCATLVRRFTTAIFKVRGVPTAATELKARCRQLLAKSFSPTFWTEIDTGRADFAHHFGFMTATATLKIVYWHGLNAS